MSKRKSSILYLTNFQKWNKISDNQLQRTINTSVCYSHEHANALKLLFGAEQDDRETFLSL